MSRSQRDNISFVRFIVPSTIKINMHELEGVVSRTFMFKHHITVRRTPDSELHRGVAQSGSMLHSLQAPGACFTITVNTRLGKPGSVVREGLALPRRLWR
jgi:hypothetical protein